MNPRTGLSAICALIVALAAAQSAHGVYQGPVEGARSSGNHHRPYLGERGSWVPSRLKPRSVLWAVGDGADGGANGQAVAALIAAHRVHRFLYLGDVYNSGTAAEFAANYRPLFGRFDPITAPTIGNHEWANRATGYEPYWQAVRGSRPPWWYSFAASGWQVLSLNSNAPKDESSPQVTWLRRRLASTPRYGSCRIALVHAPRFSAGFHGDEADLQPTLQTLYGRARIMLSGHDHNMQRFLPVGGVTQVVNGSGRNRLHGVNESDPRLAFSNDTTYGALRLKLRPGRAILSFLGPGGALLDRSTVHCKQRVGLRN